MFYAESLTKSFGDRDLFKDVSFVIGNGERVGLVGPNGAGKTTLIRMLSGEEPLSSGRAGHRNGTIGYLKQQADFDPANTLVDEMWIAFPDIVAIRHRLAEIERALTDGASDFEALIDEQTELFTRLEMLNGYGVDALISRVLRGLGFSAEDQDKLCGDFSGGWRMRIGLAKIFVRRPDHVLLDEPTNHLDAPSREWLATELSTYPGTVLVITHDNDFLNRIAQRILEVDDGQIEIYHGNHSDYLRQKKAREEQLRAAAERQQREIERQERFIERFRAKATKAAQVQSREKALEKIERIEPKRKPPRVRFVLRAQGRTELQVLSLRSVSHTFEDRPVLLDVNLSVERGHRVVLVGPNGGGKSTFLRILAGALQPDEGEIQWSERSRPGYYAQHQDEALDPSRTAYDEVAAASSGAPEERVRGVLGQFLFRGDDVFKPVRVLSGGERSRVALAKFLIQPTNVLLLDEPTNHLDQPTRERLIEALQGYDGTIICASHDPAILDGIATHVYEVKGGEFQELRRPALIGPKA